MKVNKALLEKILKKRSGPPKRKKSEKFVREELQGIKEEVQNNSSTLGECKTMLQELIVVNKFLSLPPSVIKLVSDAFKCKICLKAPMDPPVIATRCCNVLLGCSTCINEWYSGEGGLDKRFPNCREPRGYAQTFQFKGIDDFLNGFKKLMADPSGEDEEENDEKISHEKMIDTGHPIW